MIVIEERRFRDTKPRSSAFLAELARFDNSQNVKMMTSDQIEPILFLAGDGSAEESAKTEKAVVFVQRDRGRGPWEKTCS